MISESISSTDFFEWLMGPSIGETFQNLHTFLECKVFGLNHTLKSFSIQSYLKTKEYRNYFKNMSRHVYEAKKPAKYFYFQIRVSMKKFLILIITYYQITTVMIKITNQNIVIWEQMSQLINSNWLIVAIVIYKLSNFNS